VYSDAKSTLEEMEKAFSKAKGRLGGDNRISEVGANAKELEEGSWQARICPLPWRRECRAFELGARNRVAADNVRKGKTCWRFSGATPKLQAIHEQSADEPPCSGTPPWT